MSDEFKRRLDAAASRAQAKQAQSEAWQVLKTGRQTLQLCRRASALEIAALLGSPGCLGLSMDGPRVARAFWMFWQGFGWSYLSGLFCSSCCWPR
jgi:hypothetical protein